MTDESLPMLAPGTRRILVIGSGGAGKSTVAARLAAALELPLVGLDALYWNAGWIPTPASEWAECVRAASARDAWVMDGNYGGTLAERLARCEAVVFLDLPRLVCISRIVRRAIRYVGRSRPDMPAGCPEKLSWEFVVWVWTYPSRRRPDVWAKLTALPPEKRVIILSSRRDVAAFLAMNRRL